MTGVFTALGNQWESRIATLLEGSREVQIVRRCADLADLVATASAGLGSVALVSSDLRGLDLSAVAQLRQVGVLVVGVTTSADEDAERRLRQLGVTRVVPGHADLAAFEAALADGPGRSSGGERGELDLLDPEPDHAGGGGGGGGVPGLPGGPGAPRDAGPGDGASGGVFATAAGTTGRVEDAEPGRIVAIWGPTGAPGRTTVAVTLATELAALGVPTVLVDADTYGGSVAQALSFLDEAPGIAAATRAADQGPSTCRCSPGCPRSPRPG